MSLPIPIIKPPPVMVVVMLAEALFAQTASIFALSITAISSEVLLEKIL